MLLALIFVGLFVFGVTGQSLQLAKNAKIANKNKGRYYLKNPAQRTDKTNVYRKRAVDHRQKN